METVFITVDKYSKTIDPFVFGSFVADPRVISEIIFNDIMFIANDMIKDEIDFNHIHIHGFSYELDYFRENGIDIIVHILTKYYIRNLGYNFSIWICHDKKFDLFCGFRYTVQTPRQRSIP